MRDVRPSPIAGTWYPGSPGNLAKSIDSMLQSATITELEGDVVGIIAPHAGHRYSGDVAAHAFRCLEGMEPEIVAILSPMHQPYPERLYTTAHHSYATPLGEIPVDLSLIERLDGILQSQSSFALERIRNDQEHSLEIELPFLQRVLSGPFRLLPLMIRLQNRQTCEALGRALAAVLAGTPHVLVASSDLSHFRHEAEAHRLDSAVLERIEAFDPAGILDIEEQGSGFACGRGAMAAALWAAQELGADRARVLKYATSGDVTGDRSSVVGYAAAAITRQGKNP